MYFFIVIEFAIIGENNENKINQIVQLLKVLFFH